MKGISKFFMVAAVPLLAAACTYDIEGARNLPNKGDAFHQSLQANYALLAQMEYNEQDWSDAGFFEERARMAAAAKEFPPQDPAERKLPGKKAHEEAVQLRSILMNIMEAGGRKAAPAHAGRAQAMYDCWLQEWEENIQPEDIKWCKDNFDAAFKEMKAAMVPPAQPEPPKPAPAPMAKPAPLPGPWVVYFEHNKAVLDAKGLEAVKAAAAQFKAIGAKTAVVGGYTDTSGKDDYNVALSQKRALAVSAALRKAGVSDKAVNVTAYGETSLAVKTADEVKEPQNRRAVIGLEK